MFRLKSNISALALIACLALCAVGDQVPQEKPKYTNRLAKENSPYLLMHAHNPVDWYPWGPEAFAKAKKESKLVFLSIGYSSCYWCHVMERESFNQRRRRQAAEQALRLHQGGPRGTARRRPHLHDRAARHRGSSGGWPLSMFLTLGRQADRRRHLLAAARTARSTARSRLGFKSILKIVRDNLHRIAKGSTRSGRTHCRGHLGATGRAGQGSGSGRTRSRAGRPSRRQLSRRFSIQLHGGFGSPQNNFRGAKFPLPPAGVFPPSACREPRTPEMLGHGRPPRSTRWRRAASTTTSAAASTATAPNAPGRCRTSRRCSTTTPSSSRSTPGPTAATKKPVYQPCRAMRRWPSSTAR